MWKGAVIAKLWHMGGETEGNHGEVRIGVLIMEQGIWTLC